MWILLTLIFVCLFWMAHIIEESGRGSSVGRGKKDLKERNSQTKGKGEMRNNGREA